MRLVQLNALRIGRKSAAPARWYPLSFEILEADARGNSSEFWRKTQNTIIADTVGIVHAAEFLFWLSIKNQIPKRQNLKNI